MTTMVILMGEQPAANLLPARRSRPETVLVVHSSWTQAQARRLGRVLQGVNVEAIQVDPYRIDAIAGEIRHRIQEGGWAAADLLFNLTGGTKPMSLAAYDVAQEMGAPFLYFQTEGSLSRIYHYVFDADKHPRPGPVDDVPESISLDDYLTLYLGDYAAGRQGQSIHIDVNGILFEEAVGTALAEAGCEVLRNLYPKREGDVEIDLVFRRGNQIGIVEAKLKAGKQAIDQLVAVASQHYLGTYIARFVVSAQAMHRNNLNLADAHRVTAIVLDGYSAGQSTLGEPDKQRLLAAVRGRMDPRA